MAAQKHLWDTRAWLLGILGGTIGGSMTGRITYPPIQKRVNHLPGPFGHHNADVISGVFGIFTILILPGLLSGLARRRTFWWGLLPLGSFLIFVDLEDWYENGFSSITKDWWISLAVVGGCLLISSGPVSLIRWLRVRAAHRQEALLASYQAMREAAAVPQEGVWPPPPSSKT